VSTLPLPGPVQDAAEWIAEHRAEIPEPIFPYIREKFDLTILEAIEALKRGHIIRWNGGR